MKFIVSPSVLNRVFIYIIDLPVLRKPEAETELIPCRVSLIKWVADYTHVTKKPNGDSITNNTSGSYGQDDDTDVRRTYVAESTHTSLDSSKHSFFFFDY